jgi:hypothetical protein
MDNRIFFSAEEGLKYLDSCEPLGDSFQIAISDSFTFSGQPDTMGAGMGVILDKILSFGFEPDGFEQRDGYKLYKFTEID